MQYDTGSLSFAQDLDLVGGWENLPLADFQTVLAKYQNDGIPFDSCMGLVELIDITTDFLSAVGLSADFPIFSVLIEDDEIIKAFGPAIMQDENNNPVLVVGTEHIPITFNGMEISCANLKGDIEIDEPENADYCIVSAEFLLDSGVLNLPVIFAKDTKWSKVQVKKALKNGDPLPLKTAGGGASWIKLNDLDCGRYNLTAIEERPIHEQYGRSWLLTLEGKGSVLSKGKALESALAAKAGIWQSQLKAGTTLVFNVRSKKTTPNGISVDCGISAVKSAPKLKSAPAPALKSAAPPPISEEELDNIPF